MKPGLAVTPEVSHAGHHQGEDRRQQRLQVIADKEILLTRFTHHRRGIDRVAPVRNCLAAENRIVVLQRIVAVVIAEGAFGFALVRPRLTDEREFSFRHQPVRRSDWVFSQA